MIKKLFYFLETNIKKYQDEKGLEKIKIFLFLALLLCMCTCESVYTLAENVFDKNKLIQQIVFSNNFEVLISGIIDTTNNNVGNVKPSQVCPFSFFSALGLSREEVLFILSELEISGMLDLKFKLIEISKNLKK